MITASLLLSLLAASAQVTEYTSRAAWEAAVGQVQCADFQGYANGTTITNQYASIGMTFTQGNDTVFVSSAFVVDGVGVNCNGDMEIAFSSPQTAIGCDFPGALQINVYSGASLVHASSNFAGSGSGFFGGLVSTATFDRAVITDWVDGLAYVDNVCIGGGSSLQLTYVGNCPGLMTVSGSGATPGGRVALAMSVLQGSYSIPRGSCSGTMLGLGAPVSLVAVLTPSPSGTFAISGNLPAGLCGRHMQAVDLATCGTSNVITLP